MSRQNKVNPGLYTQAGRLSPDDAARERRKRKKGAASKRAHRAKPASKKVAGASGRG